MSLQIWTHTRLQDFFPGADSPEKKYIFFPKLPGGTLRRFFFIPKLGKKIFSPESGSGRSGDLWAGRTPSLDHGFSIAPVVINRLDASLEVSNTLVDSSTRLLPNSDRIGNVLIWGFSRPRLSTPRNFFPKLFPIFPGELSGEKKYSEGSPTHSLGKNFSEESCMSSNPINHREWHLLVHGSKTATAQFVLSVRI